MAPRVPAELRVELVPIDDVRPLKLNPRRGDVDFIRDSIRRRGQYTPIIVRRQTGEVLKGNHTWHALKAEDAKRVAVLWRDIEDDAEAQAFALTDNSASDRGSYDPVDLAASLKMLDDLDGTGYDAQDYERILAEAVAASTDLEAPPAAPDEPDTPQPPAAPATQPGDIIQLGQHRLMCGDSTDPETVTALMDGQAADMVFMDPPFAIYGSSSGLSSSVTDDAIVRPFFRAALAAAQQATRLFAQVYVCTDWRSWPSIWDAAKGTRLEPKNLIVWDKGSSGLGNNWANTYELIGYFTHMPEQKTMSGHRKTGQRPVLRPNVIRANRVTGDDRLHNAAKPVPLIGEVIGVASEPGDLVADLFGGSGSVLIACAQTDRRCFTMEKDAAWCDVIVQRWEDLTGETAKRPRRASKRRTRKETSK
jgi:DNA modification methylase